MNSCPTCPRYGPLSPLEQAIYLHVLPAVGVCSFLSSMASTWPTAVLDRRFFPHRARAVGACPPIPSRPSARIRAALDEPCATISDVGGCPPVSLSHPRAYGFRLTHREKFSGGYRLYPPRIAMTVPWGDMPRGRGVENIRTARRFHGRAARRYFPPRCLCSGGWYLSYKITCLFFGCAAVPSVNRFVSAS